MSQTVRKALRSLYKPRSGCGLGEGSQATSKRLVGRLIASVQTADERMGFGQVSAVSEGRGSPRVSVRIALAVGLGGCARDTGRVNGRGSREAPFPLPPTVALAGTSRNFSPTFPLVCKLAN